MKGAKPEHGKGREALLAAVIKITAAKGLRGVTFRAVAEAAGVNNTLIVHYFGNRDSLLEAALEWSVEHSIEATDLAQYAEDGRGFRKSLVDAFVEDSHTFLFQYEMILEASRQPKLRPVIHQMYERYVDAFTRGRAKFGGEVDRALNRALFASLDGMVFQYLNGAVNQEEFIESIDALGNFIAEHHQTDTRL